MAKTSTNQLITIPSILDNFLYSNIYTMTLIGSRIAVCLEMHSLLVSGCIDLTHTSC